MRQHDNSAPVFVICVTSHYKYVMENVTFSLILFSLSRVCACVCVFEWECVKNLLFRDTHRERNWEEEEYMKNCIIQV